MPMDREIALLKLVSAPGLGPRGLTKLLVSLFDHQRDPSELLSMSESGLKDSFGIEPSLAEYMLGSNDDAEATLAALTEHAIGIIAYGDPDYPARLIWSLRAQAPAVLFTWGNRKLLDQNAVGFSGSRTASAEAHQLAANCAAALADEGLNIVSGNAPGIDTASHYAALSAGGTTTMVLPLGILNFQAQSAMRELVDPQNTVVVSQFPPRVGWYSHNAMSRNSTVCGLSDVVLVIEAGAKGGSIEAGKMALKLKKPLFVADFSDSSVTPEGNLMLLGSGGRPLKFDSELKPDLGPVISAVREPNPNTAQTNLFD